MPFIHGHRGDARRSPTYITWIGMRRRMTTGYAAGLPGNDSRWTKFEPFLFDMGDRPLGCELDRVDPTLGYSMENCRWIPRADNRRRIRRA